MQTQQRFEVTQALWDWHQEEVCGKQLCKQFGALLQEVVDGRQDVVVAQGKPLLEARQRAQAAGAHLAALLAAEEPGDVYHEPRVLVDQVLAGVVL